MGDVKQNGQFILAIDQGTTSTRALVFDTTGNAKASAQKELKVFTPKSGWVEQNAIDIWNDTVEVCQKVLQEFEGGIACIGITNQRETTIIWDKETGEPIYNAIVWQDRRTAEYCQSLKQKDKEKSVIDITGLLLDPYFSATKIQWILSQNAEWQERAQRGELLFGTVESYLIWKLSGGVDHKTDVSNASRTALMAVETQEWSPQMCDLFDVPAIILPEICDNTARFTNVNIPELEALQGVPVHGAAGDQQAALFGQACFEKGMIKSTYGTGCFALINAGAECARSKHKLLSTVAWKMDDHVTYALEGSIFVAGAAIQFLRDNLGLIEHARDTEELANSVEDTDGVFFVPALTGLGAPYWEPNARGAIFGLSRGTSKAHIARAALDAQAYQTQDLLSAMADDVGAALSEIRVDGGLTANAYMVQKLADITGLTIRRPDNAEATVWGAAAFAGLGAGLFKDVSEIKAIWHEKDSYVPHMAEADRQSAYGAWRSQVKRIL